MNTLFSHSALKRGLKTALLATATIMAAPVAVDLVSTPAFANPGAEINWRGRNVPARKTYYRSEVTGSIIPLYYTDPPYDASDSSMRVVGGKVIRSLNTNENKQFQVLDEINFLAQQNADKWETVKDLNALESSMLNRGAIEFGAVVTQAGTIAKEQRSYVFDALRNRAKAQARMVAIGDVMEKMKANNVLNRTGLRFYQDMISDQQREIEIAEDTLSRMDKTQAEAFAIDIVSLGTARLGSYVGQAFNKAQTLRQATQQVATKQTAVQTARAVEQRAATKAAETAVVQAERQAAATAVKVKTAQETANAANAAARQTGTRAAQAEAAVVARTAEAKATETAVLEASKNAGRTRVASASAKAAAESAEASLNAAKDALAKATTAEEIAAARAAVNTARTKAQTASANAARASADAAAARAQLAKAKAADGASRAALETAKTEARTSAAALSRAQTAANSASNKLATEAAKHSDELANLATKLGQQQAATGQAVQTAATNYANANARLAAANGQLATAGSATARANAAAAASAAQKELEAATRALVEAQSNLATLSQRIATLSEGASVARFLTELKRVFTKGTITETSLINRFWGALFDLTNVITDNKLSSDPTMVATFGPKLVELKRQLTEFLRSLSPEERAELEKQMKDAPAEVKALHEKLKTGTAPVDSATDAGADIGPINSGTGVAPVDSSNTTTGSAVPATGGSNGPETGEEGENTVPDAPTDLKPETGPKTPATGTDTKPPRTPRWIGMGPATGSADNGEATAVAMDGTDFQFATSIPEISFEISPAPIAAPVTSMTINDPTQSAVAVMTDEDIQNRLAAIQGIRGNLPQQSYGGVSQPYDFGYGYGEHDPSAGVIRDVQDRYRDVETHIAYRDRFEPMPVEEQPAMIPQSETPGMPAPGIESEPETQGGMVQLGSGPMQAPVEQVPQTEPSPVKLSIPAGSAPSTGRIDLPSPRVAPRPSTPPVSTAPIPVSSPAPSSASIGGTYRLQDTSSGVSTISITQGANNTLTVNGFGRPITLQRSGDSYIGEGATLFGQGNHLLRVRTVGNGLRVEAEHPSGGRFTTMLVQ